MNNKDIVKKGSHDTLNKIVIILPLVKRFQGVTAPANVEQCDFRIRINVHTDYVKKWEYKPRYCAQ